MIKNYLLKKIVIIVSFYFILPFSILAQEKEQTIQVEKFEVNIGNWLERFLNRLTENVYVIFNTNTKDAIIIDPGSKDKRIEKFISTNKLIVRKILNTHGHSDHIGANRYYADLYQVPIVGHYMDRDFYVKKNKKNKPTVFLKDNMNLNIKGFKIKVIHTPGHTPGSVCFLINGHLISGDTLFKERVGKTWGETKNDEEKKLKIEIDNIKQKLLILPEKTRVYPGHGDETTIGHEKENNPHLIKPAN